MLNLTPYPTIKFVKNVSVIIPTGSVSVGNYYFDFDAEINNSKLTGILFVPNTMAVVRVPNFNGANISTSGAIDSSATITLVDKNNERIVDALPLMSLYTLNSSGNIILRRFSNRVSLQNSFVTCKSDVIAGASICFNFYYNPNI